MEDRKICNSKVYFVGAGPGAADLITVRGKKILESADLVIYDYLSNTAILEYVPRYAGTISVETVSKRKGRRDPVKETEKLTEYIISKFREGLKIVRLKSGDPMLFSRISQEAQALASENIEFEIVPGISAGSAAASLMGIPLTDRNISSGCLFLTGKESSEEKKVETDWCAVANQGTLILYMAVSEISLISRKLVRAGKDENTPVAVIMDVSLPSQKIITGTLDNITAVVSEENIRPPAVFIVGETVNYEKLINWTRKNRNILFTGLSEFRPYLSGNYHHVPHIEIVPLEDYTPMDREIAGIEKYDWIVFTSRYGVKYFFERFLISLDIRRLGGIKVAAIGTSTADALFRFGIKADLVPSLESAQGLIDAFRNVDLKDKRILLPRSDISCKNLDKALKKYGAKVTDVIAYRNVEPENLPEIRLDNFQEIMFTSPSTVRNFKKYSDDIPPNIEINAIGHVTKKELKKCGYRI